MVFGTGKYALGLQALQYQKVSETSFTCLLNELRKQIGNKVTWEQVRQALAENFGFWGKVELSPAQEEKLQKVYMESFTGDSVQLEESEYAQDEPLASEAKCILNEIAIGWLDKRRPFGKL